MKSSMYQEPIMIKITVLKRGALFTVTHFSEDKIDSSN